MGVLQDEIAGDIGAVPTFKHCGSERVARDAWACWNPESGLWELEQVFEQSHCHQCEGGTTFVWKRVAGEPRHAIGDLNDRFRRTGLGNGTVVITRGVQDRGPDFVQAAFRAVRSFDAFSEDNYPWGEHDFGAVDAPGLEHYKSVIDGPSITASAAAPLRHHQLAQRYRGRNPLH